VSQLGGRLGLSPQRLRGDKACEGKRVFPRAPGVHGPAQLVGKYGQRFGFALFVFEFRKIFFPGLTLADKEPGGCGKGPAQVDVAELFAGRPQSFSSRFCGALH
jgi:hypothetical protein